MEVREPRGAAGESPLSPMVCFGSQIASGFHKTHDAAVVGAFHLWGKAAGEELATFR